MKVSSLLSRPLHTWPSQCLAVSSVASGHDCIPESPEELPKHHRKPALNQTIWEQNNKTAWVTPKCCQGWELLHLWVSFQHLNLGKASVPARTFLIFTPVDWLWDFISMVVNAYVFVPYFPLFLLVPGFEPRTFPHARQEIPPPSLSRKSHFWTLRFWVTHSMWLKYLYD